MARVTITAEEAERRLLPKVCILTGESTQEIEQHTFTWFPKAVGLFYFIHSFAMMFEMSKTVRRVDVALPVARRRQGGKVRRLLGIGVTLIGVFAASVGLRDGDNIVAGFGVVMVVVGIAASIYLSKRALRAVEIAGDDALTLDNVHPAFVDALTEDRRRDREAHEERLQKQNGS